MSLDLFYMVDRIQFQSKEHSEHFISTDQILSMINSRNIMVFSCSMHLCLLLGSTLKDNKEIEIYNCYTSSKS